MGVGLGLAAVLADTIAIANPKQRWRIIVASQRSPAPPTDAARSDT